MIRVKAAVSQSIVSASILVVPRTGGGVRGEDEEGGGGLSYGGAPLGSRVPSQPTGN